MIFDHGGQVVGVDQKEHEQIFPKPGWVEHDPAEIWTRSQEVIPGALAKASLSAGDIAAIGITNQRETTVVWDRSTGQAIHNALVRQDTRTDQICNELIADGGQDRFREKTGLPDRHVFLRPEGPMDPRERRRGAGSSRCRRTGVRQHRHPVHRTSRAASTVASTSPT